ncbi:type IV pilus biogenesis/stability protein PilW [Ferrimonas balearica]|uniref:type IV pilus biogenesis/stability protein PilW n=1 Tax=Ferrimonas balearica TaxID=44012 RepID=UPI001C99F30F|nr:type IV pilus biogenesis/stability protein PilW [Ferrimonas balearica]MBY5992827.1 type IV pilus biogenesis/stability protein PilW [Ferrimonas balearica]
MNRICLLALACLGLGGCVQQTTYSGTDQPVVEQKYNAVAAARERIALGLTYLRRGNMEQAKFNLDRALKQAPDLDEAHLALAYYYETVSDTEQAERAYRRALSANRNNADAANNYGVFLCRQGRYKDADQWMSRAVKMPNYIRQAQTYENLGLCAREAGWEEKAQGYFVQALNYDPRRAVSLLEVAQLAFARQQPSEARKYLSRYHDNGNESPDSLLLGVELALDANDTDAARRYGVLLLAKYPGSEQAKTYRTKYY